MRTFKGAEHESIVAFHEFIITPSYALVVMDYHPRLVPVHLPESRAKPYIAQLLSALEYLHVNGATHNDVKPSNILLSKHDKAVLCDFGFARKYDRSSRDAAAPVQAEEDQKKPTQPFMSTLSWGTPEYLSPERVKGRLHDERLSDLWSLGVTAYEVLASFPEEADRHIDAYFIDSWWLVEHPLRPTSTRSSSTKKPWKFISELYSRIWRCYLTDLWTVSEP